MPERNTSFRFTSRLSRSDAKAQLNRWNGYKQRSKPSALQCAKWVRLSGWADAAGAARNADGLKEFRFRSLSALLHSLLLTYFPDGQSKQPNYPPTRTAGLPKTQERQGPRDLRSRRPFAIRGVGPNFSL